MSVNFLTLVQKYTCMQTNKKNYECRKYCPPHPTHALGTKFPWYVFFSLHCHAVMQTANHGHHETKRLVFENQVKSADGWMLWFVVCGVFQAAKAYMQGHAATTSAWYLALLPTVGEQSSRYQSPVNWVTPRKKCGILCSSEYEECMCEETCCLYLCGYSGHQFIRVRMHV